MIAIISGVIAFLILVLIVKIFGRKPDGTEL